jgi:TolB protein
VSRRIGDAHLFVMNANGGGQAEVPLGRGIFDDPMFSPDGQWLAFTYRPNTSTPKALYVARVDGSEMRRLTDSAAGENDMAWSPDGRTIAVSRADAAYQIVLVDVAAGRDIGTFGVAGAKNLTPDWWHPAP